MKKLIALSLIIAVCGIMKAEEPNKAFGLLYFGMNKKDARATVVADKASHTIHIGDWDFVATPGFFQYDESNGLSLVRLSSVEQPFGLRLTDKNSESLLNTIKATFTEAGYNEIYQHVYFPKPLLVKGQGGILLLKNDNKAHYISISVPQSADYGLGPTYTIWIDVVSEEYFKSKIQKKQDQNASQAKDINNKF